MLTIELIDGRTAIEMDGSAPELILEWMKLTYTLAERLSESAGAIVTFEQMLLAGMSLLEEEGTR